MSALQGTFVHPSTQQQTPSAYLVLDDVVVSLQSQYAAIRYSVYSSKAAHDALIANTAIVTPVFSDQTQAMAPLFSAIQLAGLAAGSLDAQIRQAAYQWLQSLPQFTGWLIVA